MPAEGACSVRIVELQLGKLVRHQPQLALALEVLEGEVVETSVGEISQTMRKVTGPDGSSFARNMYSKMMTPEKMTLGREKRTARSSTIPARVFPKRKQLWTTTLHTIAKRRIARLAMATKSILSRYESLPRPLLRLSEARMMTSIEKTRMMTRH